jgi:hypothetical protein
LEFVPCRASIVTILSGYGFTIECPTGSGRWLTLLQVAAEIARRIYVIFHRGPNGRRPLYGGTEKFQTDPHWRDLVLFYEYFHGDNGAGIDASHQTGWTGCVSLLSMLSGSADAMASAIDGSWDQFFAAVGGIRGLGCAGTHPHVVEKGRAENLHRR